MITIASFFATACVFDKLSIIMLVCLPACEHLPVTCLSDDQLVGYSVSR